MSISAIGGGLGASSVSTQGVSAGGNAKSSSNLDFSSLINQLLDADNKKHHHGIHAAQNTQSSGQQNNTSTTDFTSAIIALASGVSGK